MRVLWSPRALERVEEIFEIIRWDKPGAARRWVEKVFYSVEGLTELPRQGRVVPEVGREEVRELLLGNYRVVYRIDERVINILTIRHGRQLLDLDEVER
jgi:toxin ParE1/3/4